MRADEATKFIAVGFLAAFWPVTGRASTRVRTPLLTNCLLQTLFGRTVGQASDKLSVAMTSVGLDVGLCSFLQWFGFYKFLAFTILPQAPLSIYYYETCSFFSAILPQAPLSIYFYETCSFFSISVSNDTFPIEPTFSERLGTVRPPSDYCILLRGRSF